MVETVKITQDIVWSWIESGEDEFQLRELKHDHQVKPGSANFDMAIKRLVESNKIKRVARGIYRKIKPIEPIAWYQEWDKPTKPSLDFMFPRSHIDNTSFNLEHIVNIYEGDMILISGVSNYGKTTLALNLLAENLGDRECLLMGNEYVNADRSISDKFKARMKKMSWANWLCGVDRLPMFELLPVFSDYEDYIRKDALNIIDWISMEGDYFLIDKMIEKIKHKLGRGILVAVLQKNRTSEYGEGGEKTERFADVSLKIDPYGEDESMLTIGKVKASKCKASGRRWAFQIVNGGADLANIREVKLCRTCYGYGKSFGNICDTCNGRKYV